MQLFEQNVDLNELRKYKVFSKNGHLVGSVIDFAFDMNYKLTRFVIGGTIVEELQERLRLKPDDDPVVPISLIDTSEKISDKSFKLLVEEEKLLNKLQKEAFEEGETLFSHIKKTNVVCNDNQKVGNIVDVIVCPDLSLEFIIGENQLVEFMEKIKLMKNYDLLLPSGLIQTREDRKLVIKKSKQELDVVLNNQLVKLQEKDLDTTSEFSKRPLLRLSLL